MKRIILCIIILLLLPAMLIAQKQPKFAEPILLGEHIDPYTYLYRGNYYFNDPMAGKDKVYQYGNMTPEEYKDLRYRMYFYNMTFDRNLIQAVMWEWHRAVIRSSITHKLEITADSYKYWSDAAAYFDRLNWMKGNPITGEINHRLIGEKVSRYMNGNVSPKNNNVLTFHHHYDLRDTWSYVYFAYYDTKHLLEHQKSPFADYWLRTGTHGHFFEYVQWADMPYYKDEKTNTYKQVMIDHSIFNAELYPDNFKIWYNLPGDKSNEHIGMVDRDDIKVYNEESPFIYVYDFDRYREGTYDWYFHDRMVYGYMDNYSDDKSNPFELAYVKRFFKGKPYPRMSRLYYGPVLKNQNHESALAIRVFNHIRMELAKNHLASNVHPGPIWNNKVGDYEYSARPLTRDRKKLFPGLDEYSNTSRYNQDQAIRLFQQEVRKMNVYDYWEGLDQSADIIFEDYEKYKAAISRYTNNRKDTASLRTAQLMTRRIHLIEAYRDLHFDMAQRPATALEKNEDHNAYFSEDRLSMAIWSGSTSYGADKHRADHTLKTAIPYFEGPDRPGNMGDVRGTRKFRYWVVSNFAGWFNQIFEANGFPDMKYDMIATYKHIPRVPFRGRPHDILAVKLKRTKIPESIMKYKSVHTDLETLFGPEWRFFDIKIKPHPLGDGMMSGDDPKEGWQRISRNRVTFFKFTHKEKPGFREIDTPNGVITNTGGILHGGYITGKDNIEVLRKQYGSMRNAWKTAEKGPYMIVSSRTYNKLGHEYFEKKAGRKLFKADVTGAMVESTARTIIDIPDKDREFSELMKDPYFRITDKRDSNEVKRPDIDYNRYMGKRVSLVNKNKVNIPAHIEERIKKAIAEDEKMYPGCNITGLSYMVNPDATKGLMFLNLLKKYHTESTLANIALHILKENRGTDRGHILVGNLDYMAKGIHMKERMVRTSIKSQRELRTGMQPDRRTMVIDPDKYEKFKATAGEVDTNSDEYRHDIARYLGRGGSLTKDPSVYRHSLRYYEGFNFKEIYYNNIRKLQSEIIEKRVPAFIANPNLFLAYYDLVEDIDDYIYTDIRLIYHLPYPGNDDPVNFINFTTHKGNRLTSSGDNIFQRIGLYNPVYFNVLLKRTFNENSRQDPNTGRVEAIAKRYITDSFDREYLDVRLKKYIDRTSKNSGILGAEGSRERVALLPEEKKNAFPYLFIDPLSSGEYQNIDYHYDYLEEVVGTQGRFVNIMRSKDMKNTYIKDLGTPRNLYNSLISDTYKEDAYNRLFPGIVKNLDSSGYYSYRNYCTYKTRDRKINFSGLQHTQARYSDVDYEPAIISEAYLRTVVK